jgi:hypothetical protein
LQDVFNNPTQSSSSNTNGKSLATITMAVWLKTLLCQSTGIHRMHSALIHVFWAVLKLTKAMPLRL